MQLSQLVAKKKYLVFAAIALIIAAIFITVRLAQQQQENRSKASASTTLSLLPEKESVTGGDTFNVDIMVDPGQNYVSIVDAEISYNPNYFDVVEVTNDTNTFPVVLQNVWGPNAPAAGYIRLSASIGSDPTKAIQNTSKVGTITFRAKGPWDGESAQADMGLSRENSRVFSLASQDQPDENVLANTSGVTYITINKDPNLTPPPSGFCATPTPCPPGTREVAITPDACGYSYTCVANTPTPTLPPVANCSDPINRPDLCTCTPNSSPNQCQNVCSSPLASVLGIPPAEGYCCPAGQQYCPTTGQCGPSTSECPTNVTTIGINFALPGIGIKAGDNTHPRHPNRNALVEIYDTNNEIVALNNGTFAFRKYSNATQNQGYSGFVNFGNLPSGTYQIALTVDNSLKKRVQGVFNIQGNTMNYLSNELPNMVTGDIIHDNVLDLLDWNRIIVCYNDSTCDDKAQADLNDDGTVDEIDVNVFSRGLAIRFGDTLGGEKIDPNLSTTATPYACPTVPECRNGTLIHADPGPNDPPCAIYQCIENSPTPTTQPSPTPITLGGKSCSECAAQGAYFVCQLAGAPEGFCSTTNYSARGGYTCLACAPTPTVTPIGNTVDVTITGGSGQVFMANPFATQIQRGQAVRFINQTAETLNVQSAYEAIYQVTPWSLQVAPGQSATKTFSEVPTSGVGLYYFNVNQQLQGYAGYVFVY